MMAYPGRQEKKKVQALNKEASKLKHQYWRLDKTIYILEQECPMAILRKGYQTLHSQDR